MNKIYFIGFLWFAIVPAQSQSWKHFPDSISGLSEKEWIKSIELILELDRPETSDSVYSLIAYLSTIYSGQQEASRDTGSPIATQTESQKEKLLQFLAEFVTWKSEQGSSALLKGMVLNKTVPFEMSQYRVMVPALINYYKGINETDSALYILAEIKTNKNFAKQNDIQWSIYFSQVNSEAGRHKEALNDLRMAKHRLKGNSQKSMLRENINVATADIHNSRKDYKRAESLLLQGLRRMSKKSFPYEEIRQQTVLALATTYEKQDQLNRAMETLEQYLVFYKELPRHPESLLYLEVLYKRATLYTRLNNDKIAIAEYERLLLHYPKFLAESDPRFIDLLNRLGQAYNKTNQHHRAYVYFRWAYEMMNSNEVYHSILGIDVISNLAETYSAKGDADLAEFHSKEALQIRTQLDY